jgi:hypothetical protein
MPSSALAEHLAHCTVHIVTQLKDRSNPGTAFLLNLRIDEDKVELLLITNKHIIEDSLNCSIYLSQMEDGKRCGGWKEILLPSGLSNWTCHPDAAIDLVALPIQTHLEWVEQGNGLRLCRSAITEEMIATFADLATMPFAEEILVIGYPNALWDEENNLPLFSKGLTRLRLRPTRCKCGSSPTRR